MEINGKIWGRPLSKDGIHEAKKPVIRHIGTVGNTQIDATSKLHDLASSIQFQFPPPSCKIFDY